jgi:hypothetical protein
MRGEIEPELTRLMSAFRTTEQVEVAIRRQQKRHAALIQLADEVHAQRVQLARDLRSFLYEAA